MFVSFRDFQGEHQTKCGKASCILTNVAIWAAIIAAAAGLCLLGNEITKACQNGGDMKEWLVDVLKNAGKWGAVAAGVSAVGAGILYVAHKKSVASEEEAAEQEL